MAMPASARAQAAHSSSCPTGPPGGRAQVRCGCHLPAHRVGRHDGLGGQGPRHIGWPAALKGSPGPTRCSPGPTVTASWLAGTQQERRCLRARRGHRAPVPPLTRGTAPISPTRGPTLTLSRGPSHLHTISENRKPIMGTDANGSNANETAHSRSRTTVL